MLLDLKILKIKSQHENTTSVSNEHNEVREECQDRSIGVLLRPRELGVM